MTGTDVEKQPTTGILEEFRVDFLECWQKLPNKGLFLFLLAAWLAVFQFLGNSTFGFVKSPSLLRWMYDVFQPEHDGFGGEDSHGMIVPFLVLGLFWWKRKELTVVQFKTWSPGLLLLGLAVLLHLAGYAVQQPRLSIIALFTGIYGLMGLAWGPAWLRACFFPYFLFVFCVPFGTLAQPITFPLRLLVCRLVEFVCHYVLAIDVLREGTALKDPTGRYSYEVAAACSGIRSLVAIFLMATVYSFIAFRGFWKRLLLLASAFPLAVLGNLARMLFIIIAAELWGQSAGNYVHESTVISIIPYIPAIIGLFLIGRWLEGQGQER